MDTELTYYDEDISVIKVIGDYIKTATQSVKVVLIEKDGEKLLSLQKWWRKSEDEPWREGKGFHFSTEEFELIKDDFEKALDLV